VVVDRRGESPHFRYVAPATSAPGDPAPASEVQPEEPLHAPAFAPRGFTAMLLQDVGRAFQPLLPGGAGPAWLPLAACGALSLFVTASGFIVRAGRWPVLGILLLLAVWRGAFALQRLFDGEVGEEIAKLVDNPTIDALLPSAVFLVLGLLFVIVDAAFVPYDLWKREIEA